MKNIVVSIVNFNDRKNTLECLNSIDGAEIKDYSFGIIIINNGSEEKFTLKNQGFRTKIKVIENRENLGFSGGHNIGIKYALSQNADYILVLNNDTIVDKNLIAELLKIAEANKKVGIVVPKIYFAKGYEFHKDRYKKEELGRVIWFAGGEIDWKNLMAKHRGVDEVDRGQYDKIQETEFATGACMLLKRELIEKIGFFDDAYFLYYEDTDLSQRAIRGGYKILYAPKAFLWHKNAASTGGSGSRLQDYYTTRNRLLFGTRYGSMRLKLALLKESARLLINGRQWQKRGVLDFFLRRFGKGSFRI